MDQHESVKSCRMPVINDRHLTTVFSMINLLLLAIILKCKVFVQQNTGIFPSPASQTLNPKR